MTPTKNPILPIFKVGKEINTYICYRRIGLKYEQQHKYIQSSFQTQSSLYRLPLFVGRTMMAVTHCISEFLLSVVFIQKVIVLVCIGVTCYQGYVCTTKYASNPKSTHNKDINLEGIHLVQPENLQQQRIYARFVCQI